MVANEIVSGMVDVGYDTESLNMAVCFDSLIFLGYLCLAKLFSFIAAKSRTVTKFFLVLIILVS